MDDVKVMGVLSGINKWVPYKEKMYLSTLLNELSSLSADEGLHSRNILD